MLQIDCHLIVTQLTKRFTAAGSIRNQGGRIVPLSLSLSLSPAPIVHFTRHVIMTRPRALLTRGPTVDFCLSSLPGPLLCVSDHRPTVCVCAFVEHLLLCWTVVEHS